MVGNRKENTIMKSERGMNQYMFGFSHKLIGMKLKEISKLIDAKAKRNLITEKERAEYENLANVSVRLFKLNHERRKLAC